MLRLPVKCLLVIFATLAIVLGLHSIWVYINTPVLASYLARALTGAMIPTENDALLMQGSVYEKLFMFIDVWPRLQYPVLWASLLGIRTWLSGAFLIVVGSCLFYWNDRIYYNWHWDILRKLHLW